jgi:hypothetical protein
MSALATDGQLPGTRDRNPRGQQTPRRRASQRTNQLAARRGTQALQAAYSAGQSPGHRQAASTRQRGLCISELLLLTCWS